MLPVASLKSAAAFAPSFCASGHVVATRGPLLLARIPGVRLGEICRVKGKEDRSIAAQAVAFSEDLVSLAPFDFADGIGPGAEVQSSGSPVQIEVHPAMTGLVLDALGNPLNSEQRGLRPDRPGQIISVINSSPAPLTRRPIRAALASGIKSIDGLCSIGQGQRLGLFAAAGVGKSTLLGMLARNTAAEVNVIALVGERGREVRDFIEEVLGAEGLAKSVIVAATSDECPIRRYLAPFTATAIAEYFRDQGKEVLLLIDSITRTARAMRDVGLAAGELPVRHGYPPSVYTELPRLLERAGNNETGSITAIYTVLTSGEGESDPLAEEVKSIMDGHLVLDSQMALRGVWPAIDPLQSISRLMPRFHGASYLEDAQTIRSILARLKRDRDILLFGGEANKELRAALEIEFELLSFLSQKQHENCSWQETLVGISTLARKYFSLSSPKNTAITEP